MGALQHGPCRQARQPFCTILESMALPRTAVNVIDVSRAGSDYGLGLGASPLEQRMLDDVRAAAACFAGGPAGGDVFDGLRAWFGFQGDSVRNVREAAVLLLASRLSRTTHAASTVARVFFSLAHFDVARADSLTGVHRCSRRLDAWRPSLSLAIARPSRTSFDVDVEGTMSAAHVAAVEALRDDALWNYRRWCAWVGATPLCVARALRSRAALGAAPVAATDGAAYEIALAHLVWGEASNLRFCPEFLCAAIHEVLGELVASSRTARRRSSPKYRSSTAS